MISEKKKIFEKYTVNPRLDYNDYFLVMYLPSRAAFRIPSVVFRESSSGGVRPKVGTEASIPPCSLRAPTLQHHRHYHHYQNYQFYQRYQHLCEETISRTDEGQPRQKYIFNKCGTNIYFLLCRGLVHHHHRILNK